MSYFVFGLETRRNDLPLKGKPYGEAKLYDPYDPGRDSDKEISPLLVFEQNPGLVTTRKGPKDSTWEQRVIGAALSYLQKKGYHLWDKELINLTNEEKGTRMVWFITTSR
jgi:hypothetical protein